MTKQKSSSPLYLKVLAVAGFALVAVISAAWNGIPYGNDLTQHYQFAAAVSEAMSRGEYYPSLSPEANGGVGDYGIRFYPPLAYYALALAFNVFGSWFWASILVFFAVYFAGGIGVFLWTREEFPERQALIAAALFVFAPYHLNQIYNNFLYAEFAASALIPFCFLFLQRTAKEPSVRSAAGLALSYGLLVLTHLPSLIFCSIAFAVYGLVVIYRSRTYFKALPALAGAVTVAIASTSFYWIKLITELEWLNHAGNEYFSNIYGYANNFLLNPRNLANARDDVLAIWMGDLMLLAMVVIALPSIVLIIRRKDRSESSLPASLAAAAVAVFMASILSKPLWDHIGFLQKIQFPWRWMGVVSAAGAVFASYGIYRLTLKDEEKPGAILKAVLALGVLFFTVSAVFITKQSVFLPPADFTNEKVSAMRSDPSRDCWWTIWAKEGFYRRGKNKITAEGRGFRVRRWDTLEKQAGFAPGPETEAVFAVQFYPHWRAFADDRRIETSPTEDGLLKVAVPKNVTSVTLRFREPDNVRAAAVVSTTAFALIVFTLLFSLARRTFHRSDDKNGTRRLNA
ncbi:MAG TPA: 6-pyruvoyl-tetrahydropterin synthase-related protein [Aridibacter sp.]|nr:6-pyruvoyl-tetrahydropterin synthase-related protein [Aridibacter sp.]